MTKEGILLINKPAGRTSFSLVAQLRRLSKIKKIGHAGTLDPFATGVMVLLIGRDFTRKSSDFLTCNKAYRATVKLGSSTDSYDLTGTVTASSDVIPEIADVYRVLEKYQGEIQQTPPMFSAKKIGGKKLYELARKGKEIEREAQNVTVQTTLVSYSYPYLVLDVECSKGTYIRSIADDIGKDLKTFGHLEKLIRTKSGSFLLEECVDGNMLDAPEFDYTAHLRQA